MTKRALLLTVAVSLAIPALAVDKGKAKYVGGTTSISGLKEKDDYPIDLKDQEKLVYAGGKLEIPWASVKDVEYGQKSGRRLKTAIFLSPIALFSKARHHYVTVAYDDEAGAEQAVVLEFDKNDIRMALATFKARTDKDITYQDEEAQKQMGGGKQPAEKKE